MDGRFRIGSKQHDGVGLFCLISMDQADDGGLIILLFSDTLGSLEASVVAVSIPFWTLCVLK